MGVWAYGGMGEKPSHTPTLPYAHTFSNNNYLAGFGTTPQHTEIILAQPQAGNTVSIHYTGRLEDGTVFDSSEGGDPLTFTVGTGQVIPGFEHAVLGLEIGQKGTTTIPPEEGYGNPNDDLIVEMPRTQLPAGIQPELGQHFQLSLEDGTQLPVVVAATTEATVTFDANHPLAGKTLIFDIELLSVE